MNLKYYTQVRKALRRVNFYISEFARYALPSALFRWYREFHHFSNSLDSEAIQKRVDYYCRFTPTPLNSENSITVGDFKYPFGKKKKYATYFFDLYHSLVYFRKDLRFRYEFGDITHEPEVPTIVKSRPIKEGQPTNSVIMKLNKKRHYVFIRDKKTFAEKKDMLVFRNSVHQAHRVAFIEQYFGHPKCVIGKINKDMIHKGHTEWIKGFMSIEEQLNYKYVCCIEGNDVATNLKWVMSSNSLPVMPRPKFESWFMEGTLIPGYHYVEIKEDYSDLIEKMEYYTAHPEKAEAIIRHNHEYIKQFQNSSLENTISLLVLKKYFLQTKQPVK